MILVLDEQNQIPADSLYQLGLITGKEYRKLTEQIKDGKKAEEYIWNYKDICSHTFYMLPACDHYEKQDGLFQYAGNDSEKIESLLKKGVKMKITGVIRSAEDAENANISTAVGYTSKLTDYVELLTSSITSIVNVISYVLIAFVAVSLIVSCIMVGIITHISVLERTKEIGILRALGASKRNISHVFNAETMIVGLCAGVLGVGISALLTIPINSVIRSLLEAETLSASLPISAALLLIVLSMGITVIAGLIPSRAAAKKDPVAALRTEYAVLRKIIK